jgi:hypothetical protein
VCPVAKRPVVFNGAVGRRVLHERAEDVLGELEPGAGPDNNAYAECRGPRADDLDVLRMARVGDKKHPPGALPAYRVEHHHRFRGRRRFVEERSIGDVHPREVGDDGLVIQKGFQTPLGDLRLVRRVRGIPPRIFQDVPEYDGGGDCIVIPHADE